MCSIIKFDGSGIMNGIQCDNNNNIQRDQPLIQVHNNNINKIKDSTNISPSIGHAHDNQEKHRDV